jgi:4-hydroxy-tetrahydrodipicolinate synthase
MNLFGIIPPLVTPLQPDGSVDTQSLCRLVEYLIKNGVHGLFVLGSTGECAQLTDAQRQIVLDTVITSASGAVPVVAGIIENSTERMIEQGLRARKAGAQAVVATAPSYYTHTQHEIIEHFRALRNAIDLPVIAYNIPSMVKVNLSPETIRTLAQEQTIVALKDTSPDLSATRGIILACRDIENFSMFTGLEWVTDLALEIGAHGAVPGLGNVAPADYVAIYNAVNEGDLDTARRHQERMIALFEICYQGNRKGSQSANAFGGFKSALVWLGILEHTTVARPMTQMDSEGHARVRTILEQLGFLEELNPQTI